MRSDSAPIVGNNKRPCVAKVVNPFRATASTVKRATSQTTSHRPNCNPRTFDLTKEYMWMLMPVTPRLVNNWMIHNGSPTASHPTFPQYVQRIWLETALMYFSVRAFFRKLKSRH